MAGQKTPDESDFDDNRNPLPPSDDLVVVGQELEFEEYQQCDGTDDEADQGDQPKQKPSWTVPDCGGSCQELDEYVARKLAAQWGVRISAKSSICARNSASNIGDFIGEHQEMQ